MIFWRSSGVIAPTWLVGRNNFRPLDNPGAAILIEHGNQRLATAELGKNLCRPLILDFAGTFPQQPSPLSDRAG